MTAPPGPPGSSRPPPQLYPRTPQLLETPKVFLFPFFSVGVNLGFIALLNEYQADPVLNPLFHILHDAAGTEMGVAVIAALVYAQRPAGEQDD